MFILQIILFLIYLNKRLKPIKNFMLIFNNKNQTNNDNITKKYIKSNSPPKNNNSIINPKDGNKKQHKKKKLKNNKDIINDSNSNKKIVEDYSFNLKNLLKIGIQSDTINKQIFSNPIINTNEQNIISNISIQANNIHTPVNNLNNNQPKKEINLIDNSERNNINSNKQHKDLVVLEHKNNSDKINKKKSKSKKHFKKKNLNKKIKSNNVINLNKLETIANNNSNINKLNININRDIKQIIQWDSELQDLDYEEAIILDKRN